ncbi:MAG: tetratricopeptide repeat protein, partial [Gemmataceae bacterium]|nr:tetratricopeptide repeat protein [Gemmataceae bacterium]
MGCALLLVLGAAAPAKLTPEQERMAAQARALLKSATVAIRQGRRDEALACLEKALEADLAVHGPWSWTTQYIADRFGGWSRTHQGWALAARCQRAAVEARAKLYGPAHRRTAEARLLLAEAEAELKRPPAERAALLRTWSDMGEGLALMNAGQYAEAVPLFRKAALARKGILGPGHRDYAMALHNLATALNTLGRRAESLPLFEEARAILKKALGEEHTDYSVCLNGLGLLYLETGDAEKALALLRQAEAISRAARDSWLSNRLGNLGLAYAAAGQFAKARACYAEALPAVKRLYGTRSQEYAAALSSLARLDEQTGDKEAALAGCRAALRIKKDVLGRKHPDYALGLHNLGGLLMERGQLKEAREHLGEALAINEAALGEGHVHYAITLNTLALARLRGGEREAGLRLLDRSVALALAWLEDDASVQSDRQQMLAASLAQRHLVNRLMLADQFGSSSAGHVLAWKGQVLARQIQRRLFVRLAADPEARAAAAHLQDVASRLASWRGSPGVTKAGLAALEQEQEKAQAALARLSAAFRAARSKKKPDPAALAASLPEGAVLVDYFFHGQELSAWAYRRGREPARIALGDAAPVAEAVRRWQAQLAGGKEPRAGGAALKKLVLAPLSKHLDGCKVLLVSPDGVLGLVPFAALPGKKEGTYLVEEVAVAVVPVPRSIPGLMEPRGEERLPPSLLVAGGLRYDPAGVAPAAGEGEKAAPRTGREKFAPLPGAATEARAVCAAFGKRHEDGKAVSLAGGEATKAPSAAPCP